MTLTALAAADNEETVLQTKKKNPTNLQHHNGQAVLATTEMFNITMFNFTKAVEEPSSHDVKEVRRPES